MADLENRYVRVARHARPRERARARHQGLVGVQPVVPRARDGRPPVRPPPGEPAAGAARRGGRLRGPAHARSASCRSRTPSAPTSPSTSRRRTTSRPTRCCKALAGRGRRAAGARRSRRRSGVAVGGRGAGARRRQTRAGPIGLPQARFPTEDARARRDREARRRGGRDEGPGAGAGARQRRRVGPARQPGQAARALDVRRALPGRAPEAALDELGEIDRKVEIRDARETIATRASELPSRTTAPWSCARRARAERRLAAADIAAVRTIATVVIPDGALLLVEGDRPRDHLASIFICARRRDVRRLQHRGPRPRNR